MFSHPTRSGVSYSHDLLDRFDPRRQFRHLRLSRDTIITTGATVAGQDHPEEQWIEILLPKRGYIEIIHFDTPALTRIAG